MKSNIALVK